MGTPHESFLALDLFCTDKLAFTRLHVKNTRGNTHTFPDIR